MRRVFTTRHFNRWARKTRLADDALCNAVAEMQQGLIDADLGGAVVKKRVALPGRGKSGSTRVLLATNKADRWFFVFGFEKNQQANITSTELQALRMLATDLLKLSAAQLDEQVLKQALREICHVN